jgi:hypothetical protein
VVAPEVFAIYDFLVFTRGEQALAQAFQRIREADDRTRDLPQQERMSPDLPCPFLEAERCSIYEARPLSCRGKNSLDAQACERSLRDPETRARFAAGEFPIPTFLEPLHAFHAVSAGLQLALDELYGLEAAPLELTRAMRVLVDDPEAVLRGWLARQEPFRAARGGELASGKGVRELSGRRG